MKAEFNDPLLLAGKVLTIVLQGLMALAGVVVTIMIPVVLLFRDEINAEIAEEHAELVTSIPTMPLVGLFVIIVAVVALTFLFFGKLRAIIGTVGERDPFVPENASRLNAMAWLLLAVQVLLIPAAALGLFIAEWADQIEDAEISVDAGVDLTGILMIITLFILARVFKHGAEMREDLEGTV
ncbi:DUF2975 domain-containing protein [Erythrobacter rubeus]|uniref:DUF2975 domain-containing protein n=1 Tax=Erythrobacter rubeus TaxID=2760803 RepID=A0ABR8KRS9_9SPHN|nr:DUF2975 domain-containing protein [Erythrobacter rubeus]MBD2843471.1 DUF2975 domain-containing protein [Erythrobacter rubeus]